MKPKLHSKRIVKKFLFLPKRLCRQSDSRVEWRWLCFANVVQYYLRDYELIVGDDAHFVDVCWED